MDYLKEQLTQQHTGGGHVTVTEPRFPGMSDTRDNVNDLLVRQTWESIERIRKGIEPKLSQADISSRMGWKNRGTYRDRFTCKSGHYPSDDEIDRLCNVLGTTRDQVGGYFKAGYIQNLFRISLSWDERELIACYERLTEGEQEAIRLLVRSMADGNFAKEIAEYAIAQSFPKTYHDIYPTGKMLPED